jgi:pSer/pThr/pTyr-binding forkhead associated (FHA) protein
VWKYLRGSSPPAGYGVSRLAGMCVCSGKNSDSCPRSSTRRASAPGADAVVGRESSRCRTPRPHSEDAPAGGEDPLARHSLSPRELKQLLEVERERLPFLALREPSAGLRLITLDSGTPSLTLGRQAEMDVTIAWDVEVSALHAELQCRGGEWTIVDDGLSRNGTYVNGRRVGARQRLRDGDRIRLGQTTIAFNLGGRPRAQTTVSARAVRVPDAERHPSQGARGALPSHARPTSYTTPASNQQIAEEVFLSVDAVKTHLRALFNEFGLAHLPQNQKRATLGGAGDAVGGGPA